MVFPEKEEAGEGGGGGMGRKTGGGGKEVLLEAGYRHDQISRHHLWPLEIEGREVWLKSGALVRLPEGMVRMPVNLEYLPHEFHALAHDFWSLVLCDPIIARQQSVARDGLIGRTDESQKIWLIEMMAGCRRTLSFLGDPFFGRSEIVEAVEVIDRRTGQHSRVRPTGIKTDWL